MTAKRQERFRAALAAEADRIATVRRMGAVPDGTRPGAICEAPARGAVQIYREVILMPDASGALRAIERNWQGYAALRRGDAFDVMNDQARRATRRGGEDRAPDLFSPGQVAMGRHYAALFERLDAGTMKLASLEARPDGSGRGGDVMDARLAQGAELAAMQRRIGTDVALDLRKVRPSKRDGRVAITDRALVDQVCLAGLTLTGVLRQSKWPVQTRYLATLRGALGDALDRMMGPVWSGRIEVAYVA